MMRKKQAREVRIEIMEDAVSMDDALDRLAKAIALEMHRDEMREKQKERS